MAFYPGKTVATLLALAALASTGLAARAADVPSPFDKTTVGAPTSFISEVRAGAYAHDPMSPEKGSADLNLEVLFAKPLHLSSQWDFLIPRPHVGGTISFTGRTSAGYAGLNWTYDITKTIFAEASFGGALHNGSTSFVPPAKSNAMGCSWSFHESAGLGYRVTDNWSVMANIEHFSNAGLCKKNRGLTNYGVRLGYAF